MSRDVGGWVSDEWCGVMDFQSFIGFLLMSLDNCG